MASLWFALLLSGALSHFPTVLALNAKAPQERGRVSVIIPGKGIIRSASKPIMIRIRGPDTEPVGRIMPNTPASLSPSQVLMLKPVIRFHTNKNDTSTVDPEKLYKAVDNMGLSKMAFLLRRANIGKELLSAGPLTLFSPTDEAFSLAPRGFVQTILEERNQNTLRDVLLHHVIRGHLHPEDVRNDFTMPTVHEPPSPLRFNIYAGGQVVTVSGAQFLNDARYADNVRIQAIDRVLYPVAEGNLMDKLRVDFPEMHSILRNAGLADQIASGTFTVFAPTDEALSVLPQKAREVMLNNSTLLRKVALNHVVPGTYFSAVLGNGFTLKPLGGNTLLFTTRRGLILVNGVPVTKPDQPAVNGAIHAVNRVLVPDELIQQCKCMHRYPLMPATLKPLPTNDSVGPFDSPAFGVRIKTGFSTTGVPYEPSTTEDTDLKEVPASMPEVMETGKPLVTMMTDPVDLGGGRTATFDTANSLFRRSMLVARLRRPGPLGVTVLMPTDRAFRRLPEGYLDSLRNDPMRLNRVLRLHVLEGNVDPNSLRAGDPLRTVGNRALLVRILPQRRGLFIGGTRVLAACSGTNGAVFVVDRLVEPTSPEVTEVTPEDEKPVVPTTKPEPSRDTDDLSIWRKLIDDVPDVKRELKARDEVYTMFAPTNTAFSLLPPENLKRLLEEESLKRDLIRSHVMAGALYRNMMTPELVVPSLKGTKLRFRPVFGGFEVNGIPVTRLPIVTRNGLVYVTDRLLFPPVPSRSLEDLPAEHRGGDEEPDETLEDVARRHNATTFLKWIHASGLRDLVSNQVPCTVILPTNAAIQSMSPTLRFVTLTDKKALRRLVKFHICPTSLPSPSVFENELILPTLLPNRNLRCNTYKNNTVLTISGSPVSKIVPTADDLDVVIVNRTLVPPVGDLALSTSKSPLLRNFTKIVQVSGLDLTGNNGPFTIFAPSKCVFEQMPPEEYQELISNPDAARDFVLRHVVEGSIYTTGMYDGMKLQTVGNGQLTIKVLPDCIEVNGVKIRYGDLSASNGVVHIIERVL